MKSEKNAWNKMLYKYDSLLLGIHQFINEMQKSPEKLPPYHKRLVAFAKEPALEIGSGTGKNSLLLSKLMGIHCIVCDISPRLLELSKKLFKHYSVKATFVNGDFRKMAFKNTQFPFIHSDCAIEHVRETVMVVSEISRILCPRGHVIVSVPNLLRFDGYPLVKVVKKPPYYERFFTKSKLKRVFEENDLKVIELFDYNPYSELKYTPLNAVIKLCEKSRIKRLSFIPGTMLCLVARKK